MMLVDRLLRLLPAVALALGLLAPAAAAAPQALQLDGHDVIAVWPAATMLADPTHTLSVADVLTRQADFAAPPGTPGNLGRRADAVWLRVPVHAVHAQRRVLEIDYPSLNRIDVYVVADGRLNAHHVLGNHLRHGDRPLPSRAHAAPLELPAGPSVLLVRVQTTSSMVLPMTLRHPEGFAAHEAAMHLLQGALLGLGLAMLVFALTHWLNLRDGMFLQYAAMLGGNLVFMLSYFGIGPVYLWPDLPRLSGQVAPLAVLVSAAAGASFVSRALALRAESPRTAWALRGCAVLALATIAAALLGAIPYSAAQMMAMVLGIATLVLVLPTAFVMALRGHRVASYMLFGWTTYLAGAGILAAMLSGKAEPSFFVQYVYPLSTMIEMAAWLGVLGLRVQEIHRSADRARVETETLRALALTDALTGLPNRRGLNECLAAALPQATPQQLLAVYLLDLDGFKPVNDRHGHDVGDALLVAVGQRLQHQLRGSDIVARLGGDEFVVLAAGLGDELAARRLGQKMLASFDEPFVALGQRCGVGLTIGYALAPLDGSTADDLIKRADAAMYAGKQAGRRCIQRGGRSLATA